MVASACTLLRLYSSVPQPRFVQRHLQFQPAVMALSVPQSAQEKWLIMYECHGESRFDLIPLRGPRSIPRKR